MTGQVGTPDALLHTRPRVAEVGFKGLRPNQRLLLAGTAHRRPADAMGLPAARPLETLIRSRIA